MPTLQGGESAYARFGFSGCPSRRRSQRGRTSPPVTPASVPVSRRQALGVRQQPGRGVAAASAAAAPAQAQEATALAQHLSVSLARAKRIVAAAERRARQIGVSMFMALLR